MSERTVALVAAIVDGLEPLSAATPGEPVRADDWNTVVAAVVDLAQIALASDQSAAERIDARFAPSEHAHLGEVGPAWLDAAAREQIEGSQNRIDLEQELAHANRTMAELSARMERLAGDIESVRRRLLTVEDNDLGRYQRIDRVATAVDSLGEQTTDIRDVESSLHGLRTQVGKALALRSQLADEQGTPIDLVAMRAAVNQLNGDRERLLDAAGDVLDARAIEQRIAKLETRRPSGPGGGGTVPDLDRFRAELFVEVDARLASRVGPLGADLADTRAEVGGLRDSLDARAADIDVVNERLRVAEDGLGRAQGAVAGLADLTVRVGGAETRSISNSARLKAVDTLAGRVDAIDGALAVFDGIPERVGDLDTRLAAASRAIQRLPGLENQVASLSALRTELHGLSSRCDQVGSLAAASVASTKALDVRLSTVEAGSIDLGTRFDALAKAQRTQAGSISRLSDQVAAINRPRVGGGIPIVGGGAVQ